MEGPRFHFLRLGGWRVVKLLHYRLCIVSYTGYVVCSWIRVSIRIPAVPSLRPTRRSRQSRSGFGLHNTTHMCRGAKAKQAGPRSKKSKKEKKPLTIIADRQDLSTAIRRFGCASQMASPIAGYLSHRRVAHRHVDGLDRESLEFSRSQAPPR